MFNHFTIRIAVLVLLLIISHVPSVGKEAVGSRRNEIDASIAKARELCDRRHFKAAEKICTSPSVSPHLKSYGTSVLGWAIAGQGDLQTALKLLLRAEHSASTLSDKTVCYQLMGEIYENLGMKNEAVEAYLQALRANPNHGNAGYWKNRVTRLQSMSPTMPTDNYSDQTPQNLKSWSPQKIIKVFISNTAERTYSDAVKGALSEWCSSVDCLRYEFVNDESLADIFVYFVEPANLKDATTAGQYDLQGNLLRSRIFIPRIDPSSDSFAAELHLSCLHEIGHALGIQGHSDDPKDVMYDVILYSLPSSLSERDKNTLRVLLSR